MEFCEQEELRNGSTADRKKADQAAGLQGDIYNLKFGLTLSALADIYSIFSKMVNILQVLSMMKLDVFHIYNFVFSLFTDSQHSAPCQI